MFFIPTVLGQNGPLAIIWIASHHPERLKKQEVTHVDLPKITPLIQGDPLPFSLAITGDLMYGLCVIARKQADYLNHESMQLEHKFQRLFINRPAAPRVARKNLLRFDPEITLVDDLVMRSPASIPLKSPSNIHLPMVDINIPEVPQNEVSELPDFGDVELGGPVFDNDTTNELMASLNIPQDIGGEPSNVPLGPDLDLDFDDIDMPPEQQREPVSMSMGAHTAGQSQLADQFSRTRTGTQLRRTRDDFMSRMYDLVLPRIRGRRLNFPPLRRKRRKHAVIIDDRITLSDAEMQYRMHPPAVGLDAMVREFCPGRASTVAGQLSAEDLLSRPMRRNADVFMQYFRPADAALLAAEEDEENLESREQEGGISLLPEPELEPPEDFSVLDPIPMDSSLPEIEDYPEYDLASPPSVHGDQTGDARRFEAELEASAFGNFSNTIEISKNEAKEFLDAVREQDPEADEKLFEDILPENPTRSMVAQLFVHLSNNQEMLGITIDQEPSFEVFTPLVLRFDGFSGSVLEEESGDEPGNWGSRISSGIPQTITISD